MADESSAHSVFASLSGMLSCLLAGDALTWRSQSGSPGRVYKGSKDPYKTGGFSWSGLGHQVNIVDWEGSEERYLVDVGFVRAHSWLVVA